MSDNANPAAGAPPLSPVRQEPAPSVLAGVPVDPRIATAAKAIQLMNGRNEDGSFRIDEPLAIAAAMFQVTTGQVLGRDFFINAKFGRIEGYQGVERSATRRGIGEVEVRYRRMSPEELEDNEVRPGDTAVICEIYQLEVWRKKQQLGLPYSPILGVGLIREQEKFTNTDRWEERTSAAGTQVNVKVGLKPRDEWQPVQLELGMTWHRKAKNRAYKDALRHTPGAAASGAELIAEAAGEIDGFELPPAAAVLTPGQANAWVEKQRAAAAQRARTPGQVAADQDALHAQAARVALEAKWTDWRLAMEPCPYCGVPEATRLESHGTACEFRKLNPNASADAPADAPALDKKGKAEGNKIKRSPNTKPRRHKAHDR